LLTDESEIVVFKPNAYVKFQSTSVIADGRKQRPTPHLRPASRFQSTSVIADGRKVASIAIYSGLTQFQSTSVIADGRKSASRDGACVMCRFNPRPSLLTDERLQVFGFAQVKHVSIHVRHC